MIDASKSPVPLWRRYATIAMLAVLIIAAGYIVWSKELHHSSGTSSTPPSATAPVASGSTKPLVAPQNAASATTIPGGIPVSTRNPFSR